MKVSMCKSEANGKIFLVQRELESGEFCASVMNEHSLCEYINMDDFHNEAYTIYLLLDNIDARPILCQYKGWQPNNLIEVVRSDTNVVVLSMYGTDH